MFGSQLCIGFDPTVNVRPIHHLQVSRRKVVYDSNHNIVTASIPEELRDDDHSSVSYPEPSAPAPDSLLVDVEPSQPALPGGAHHDPTSSVPDHTGIPLSPIGEIRVRDVIYEILEVLFSSAGFLGHGTVVYLVRHKGKLYIIKDHWVENVSQEVKEVKMMKHMEGVSGMPNLVDYWKVEISPGVVDVTLQYRSGLQQKFMKGMPRTHIRIVIRLRGCPLAKFRTKHELVKSIRDVLIGKSVSLFCKDI